MKMHLKISSKRILLGCLCILIQSQIFGQTKIKGRVVYLHEKPIFAANVYLKHNSVISTPTNLNGKFELVVNANQKNDTLVISNFDYITCELALNTINFNEDLKIQLIEKSIHLEEVKIVSNKSISREFSVKKLDRISIYMSPTSNGDPLKAITAIFIVH